MPQNSAAPKKQQQKKKKGHAPAHQNTFAFQHNPKSKKTQKILEMPNTHVCRRCHDKIEWRKQYRKYKPRTQPGKCNICQQRRVKAAYHTICESCTRSAKAQKTVRDQLGLLPSVENEITEEEGVEKGVENLDLCSAEKHNAEASAASSVAEEEEKSATSKSQSQKQQLNGGRACAMCVKDFALPASDDDQGEDDPLASGKRIPLRQRKTLERQRERRNTRPCKRNSEEHEDDDNNSDEDDEEHDDSENDDSNDEGSSADEEEEDADAEEGAEEELEDEVDPFLKAVGGADKLLTGEAYQQALLQKEQMMKQQQQQNLQN